MKNFWIKIKIFIIGVLLFPAISFAQTSTVCDVSNNNSDVCNEAECVATNKFFEVENKVIFCQNDKKVVCYNSFTEVVYDSDGYGTENIVRFDSYRNAPYQYLELINSQRSHCDSFYNFKNKTGLYSAPSINRGVTRNQPLGYIEIFQRISQTIYAVSVFLFVLIMIINGIRFVRSGNNPEELKKGKEGLFNAIAGFLFVLFSGGFIIYMINSMQSTIP